VTVGGMATALRTAEVNFWSLNALAVQPGYAFCREAGRYLTKHLPDNGSTILARVRLRAVSSVRAAIILSVCGALITMLTWRASRWVGTVADLSFLHGLFLTTLVNSIVVISAYFAIAPLFWDFADASMDQPIELASFDAASNGPTWRTAHLSDIHIVGERYGVRIESGRSGPDGNDRIAKIMAGIEAIHSVRPLHLVLVGGRNR
jgi:hypothetical protein